MVFQNYLIMAQWPKTIAFPDFSAPPPICPSPPLSLPHDAEYASVFPRPE